MSVVGEHTVFAAARARIEAQAAVVDRDRCFPRASLTALGEAGVLGLTVPAEHGGAGGGLQELASVCELVGGACASTGMTFLMHAVTAATVAGGGGARAGELLEQLAGGELGTLAFSERGTGAHFYAPELSATRDGEQLRISGRKSFVTSGGHAGVYLVLVRSEDGAGLDCFAIRGDAAGLSFEDRWQGVGMAGNASVAMTLVDVAVCDEDRIGAPGRAGELVFGVVAPHFLVGLAAVNAGIAGTALSAATAHVTERTYADGSSLAQVQAIQHALADLHLAGRQARLLTREAAALGDAGDAGALVAIMAAKVAATEAARTVAAGALEICGGQGYTAALPIERHLRDAHAGAVMAPTNGVLRNWIGKSLVGLPVP